MKGRNSILFAVLIAVSACNQKVEFDKSYDNRVSHITAVRFSVDLIDGGKPISSKMNLSNGPFTIALKKLLEEKKSTWKKSKQISYAPRLLFTTNGMSLNVRDDVMVLNLQIADNKWVQYVSPNSSENFNQLIDIFNTIEVIK